MGGPPNIRQMGAFLDAHEDEYKRGRFDTTRHFFFQFLRFVFALSGADSADSWAFRSTLVLAFLIVAGIAVLPSGIACASLLQRRRARSKIVAAQLKPNLDVNTARFLFTVPKTFKPGKPTIIQCRGQKVEVMLPNHAKPGEKVVVSVLRKDLDRNHVVKMSRPISSYTPRRRNEKTRKIL